MVAGNKKVRSFCQSGENGKGDGCASLGFRKVRIAERCGGSQGGKRGVRTALTCIVSVKYGEKWSSYSCNQVTGTSTCHFMLWWYTGSTPVVAASCQVRVESLSDKEGRQVLVTPAAPWGTSPANHSGFTVFAPLRYASQSARRTTSGATSITRR